MTEKEELPKYAEINQPKWHQGSHRPRRRIARLAALAFVSYMAYSAWRIASNTAKAPSTLSVSRLQEDYAMCAQLRRVPEDPSNDRDVNGRWVNGTKPLLIRNATVWAPASSAEGFAWINADVFVNYGLIQLVEPGISDKDLPKHYELFDAHGRPLTTGIVDMHSHAGASYFTNLGHDENELSSDITPYVKSLDAIDPLHPEFSWIKSGGVTTSLILPGSGNNMGGEAFVVKMAVGNDSGRAELSQKDMLADPDNSWRYMKMACGENAKRVYGKVGERGPFSRMGEAWEFRHAFEQAQAMVNAQNEWCTAADHYGPEFMPTYLPQELAWESLGAVLRGQIRVNTHCYTIPDLEAYVRLTNEFKFQLRAFHHAHQTYLVPEVLKRAWGGPPASALFADNMYYKVESYTGSEQAGKILHENGLVPVYVSDNPVLNSQHVVMEAAKAFRAGLPYHVALAGVTSQPARLLGLGNRVGKVAPGFDADLLVWDSDPLSVGAAPEQAWIDGAPQFKHPVVLEKPWAKLLAEEQHVLADYTTQEIKSKDETTIFTGITNVQLADRQMTFASSEPATMVIRNGEIECLGECAITASSKIVALKDGHVTDPFVAFGTILGTSEIDAQGQTQDGSIGDGWSRAVDGLLNFGGKQLAAAYAKGVTRAISAPVAGHGAYRGVSAGFSTGAATSAAEGAIFANDVAVHYTLSLGAKQGKTPSISAAVAALRTSLLEAANSNTTSDDPFSEQAYLKRVVAGDLPLVITVHSAETMAAVMRIKQGIESVSGKSLRLIIHGGAESHLVADALAEYDIPVILAPLLAYSQSWDQRRSLTGAPLANGTAIDHLLAAGVKVAIGANEPWESRDLPLMSGIALANSQGKLDYASALKLIGGNLYEMLGLKEEGKKGFVLFEGSPLQIEGRVRAVSDGSGKISVWV